MSRGGSDDGQTRVWQAQDMTPERPRRGQRREQGGPARGGGARRWQVGWRLVLWAFALGLGWYAGMRYFG